MSDLKELLLQGKATGSDYEEAIARLYGALLKCDKKQASVRYWKRLREEQNSK